MRLVGTAAFTLGLGGLMALTTARPAHACGGFFCDAGPNVVDPEAMPVDQTGETIVFVVGPTHVEAHIQIQYDPESGAERFAWLIPILGTSPEFSVSSQQLFLNLQNSTVPSYGYVNEVETCGGFGDDGNWDDGWGGGDYCDGTSGAAGDGGFTGSPGTSAAGSEGGDDGETTGGGTEVVSSHTIGAFDVVVLQSQTAEELMTWLGDNEFYQDPNATPILQEYIEDGAMFAAIRLTNGAGVGEVHPLEMRYEGTEPCVPIRLTAIAASEDMDIRTFFLSNTRAYPTNYRHVELNHLKLDWINLASNYKDVVTMAIDTPMVDGHGFVTEFAGPTGRIPRDGLYDERWDHAPFQSATPLEVPGLLSQQGLLSCEFGECTFGHPLIEGILAAYLPVPEGVTPSAFYECIECYEDLVDERDWDPLEFARTLRSRIIDPGQHALEILDTNPFVTRLYTTLSPHEMTLDPTFHVEPQAFDVVDDTAVAANRFLACSSRAEMQGLPGARDVRLQPFDEWPVFGFEDMPYAERVTEHLPGAAPVVLIDETEAIDAALALWNGSRAGSLPVSPSCHDPGADGVLGGCGCRADEGSGWASWALMLLAMGWGARRRRRH
ncbi:DUF2330 domain-containing protein [Paraliomyxa miuraensis]|uniref:DUF2330 domain-containing protein n=1 Tax=Paraliomyxa miuraensis TaxID=376150 RepID=UPI002253039D|nr:DUF2330 domain-containing protein [Paraliomyxa miuraensis]MCX4246811.1 DUF2330 domain-containing protein [Paraliomyxa miuraensis]